MPVVPSIVEGLGKGWWRKRPGKMLALGSGEEGGKEGGKEPEHRADKKVVRSKDHC